MTDLQICRALSVCVICYEKVREHLSSQRNSLCHICWRPCPECNIGDLLWIGDEQVICCGRDECKSKIRELDRLDQVLRKI
jgi:hypothetical protein